MSSKCNCQNDLKILSQEFQRGYSVSFMQGGRATRLIIALILLNHILGFSVESKKAGYGSDWNLVPILRSHKESKKIR